MKTFGSRLKWYRKKVKLTQKELAKRCDLSQAIFCGYENNKRQPSLETFINILKGLKAETHGMWFLGLRKWEPEDRYILTDEETKFLRIITDALYKNHRKEIAERKKEESKHA